MSFVDLVSAGDLDRLEEAWLEAIAGSGGIGPGEIEEMVGAIEHLVAIDRRDRATALAVLLADALRTADRTAELLPVLRPVAGAQGERATIRAGLVDAIRATHGHEPWCDTFLELSRLAGDAPPEAGLARFEHLLAHEPGRVVDNAAGWGIGVIQSRGPSGRLMVRFADGSVRPFDPHQLDERLNLLDEDDFRALKLTDVPRLQALAESEPGRVVISIVRGRGGVAVSTDIRDDMLDGVIPKSRWASFWKAAKAELLTNPLVSVEGSATRPKITLRKRPMTLEEEAYRRLDAANDLTEAGAALIEYVAKGLTDDERARVIERLRARLDATLARPTRETAPHAVVLLLTFRDLGVETPVDPAAFLRALVEGQAAEDGSERTGGGLVTFAQIVQAVADRDARQRIVRLVAEEWDAGAVDHIVGEYAALPLDVQDVACEVVLDAGGAEALAALMESLARLPRRHAGPLLALTKAWSADRFAGTENRVAEPQMIKMIVPIVSNLARGEREVRKLFKAWMAAVTSGRKPLLDRLLDELDEAGVREAVAVCEMHRELPDEIKTWIIGHARERFPEIFLREDTSFWDQPYLFSTEEGIRRRKEELRTLVDVKIPENSKAIGLAASFGDLSENAEWQAAIEDRGLLSQRAEEMELEVAKARPLEAVVIPEGIVAPGCRVHLRSESGVDRVFDLLGPWDVREGRDDVVSYLAPFATAVLGTPVGGTVRVELPSGRDTWNVVSVERII